MSRRVLDFPANGPEPRREGPALDELAAETLGRRGVDRDRFDAQAIAYQAFRAARNRGATEAEAFGLGMQTYDEHRALLEAVRILSNPRRKV